MRKIYPPFAVLVLYSLLSITAITLAQDCVPEPIVSTSAKKMIGYVQFFTNQPSEIEPKNVPLEFYDYINVIAYPNEDSEWNDIFRPPDDVIEVALKKIRDLVNFKNTESPPPNTQILLSIRNYDIKQWPDDEGGHNAIVDDTIKTINNFGLNGVDIEYPGMRGALCRGGPKGGPVLWGGDEKARRDELFTQFITKLRKDMDDKVGKGKILMLTAGRDTVTGLQDQINFLNIETHHYSLYENLRRGFTGLFNGGISSFPNSPLYEFDEAYSEWNTKGLIPNDKIIMGVDFGNTFQVVSNSTIADDPTVNFIPKNDENFKKEKVLDGLKRINSFCSEPDNSPLDDGLQLYSFPWGTLKSVLGPTICDPPDWTRKFDGDDKEKSMTPWLYRSEPKSTFGNYQFISYEDYFSLNTKLNHAKSKSLGGMSIFDISYDDSDRSLVKYMQVIRAKEPNIPTPAGGAFPESTEEEKTGVKTKTIIGAVFGSLFGLIILGACAFIGYRYRKKPKSESFRSLLMNIPNSIKNHTTTSRNTEMTSDPTPNMFAPPTTVIPVASGYVTAMFDFTGKEENDLSFKKGDKIEVLERGDGPNDWWVGRVNGAVGEFPGNYVKET